MRSLCLSAVFALGGLIVFSSAAEAQNKAVGSRPATQSVVPQDLLEQMAGKLTLTGEQKERVKQLIEEEARKREDIVREAEQAERTKRDKVRALELELRRLGRDEPFFIEAAKEVKARQESLHKELRRILTPDQWQQWIRLQDPGQDMIVNSIGMKLRRIPAGSFMMGREPGFSHPHLDKDRPAHKVTFTRPFYMGVYEVTQREYQEIMGRNPSTFKGDKYPHWAGRKLTTKVPYRDEYRPVDSVNWYDAQEFCARLSAREGVLYRLPTEPEWEYACRAGTTTRYYWGDKYDPAYCDLDEETLSLNPDRFKGQRTYVAQTVEVGLRKPNAWGLYDMIGNQMEWCLDRFAPYSAGDQVDPEPVTQGGSPVKRGGDWGIFGQDYDSATRGQPQTPYDGNGLRVVRVIPHN